jgi:hypothetical protein
VKKKSLKNLKIELAEQVDKADDGAADKDPFVGVHDMCRQQLFCNFTNNDDNNFSEN